MSTSPLTTRNVLGHPGVLGGEAHGAGGVERLRLDGVLELDAADLAFRGRPRTKASGW